MAWREITTSDVQTLLSEDELEKLQTLSTAKATGKDVEDAIDLIASMWRGALQAKGIQIDVRDNYVPDTYRYWIIVMIRHAIWTRFPNTPAYALDDARREEYKKALEMLASPTLAAEKPDYSDDPELSGKTFTQDSSLIVPWQHLPDDMPWIDNFKVWTWSI